MATNIISVNLDVGSPHGPISLDNGIRVSGISNNCCCKWGYRLVPCTECDVEPLAGYGHALPDSDLIGKVVSGPDANHKTSCYTISDILEVVSPSEYLAGGGTVYNTCTDCSDYKMYNVWTCVRHCEPSKRGADTSPKGVKGCRRASATIATGYTWGSIPKDQWFAIPAVDNDECDTLTSYYVTDLNECCNPYYAPYDIDIGYADSYPTSEEAGCVTKTCPDSISITISGCTGTRTPMNGTWTLTWNASNYRYEYDDMPTLFVWCNAEKDPNQCHGNPTPDQVSFDLRGIENPLWSSALSTDPQHQCAREGSYVGNAGNSADVGSLSVTWL